MTILDQLATHARERVAADKEDATSSVSMNAAIDSCVI